MAEYHFWSADESGTAFYRMQQPARVLNLIGHEAHEGRWVVPSWTARAAAIIGARVCQPGPSVQWQRWAAEGRHLVWDVDDDLFSVHRDSDAYDFFRQPDIRAAIRANAAAASTITVCSDRLAEIYGEFNADVRVVRNGLPAEVLSWDRPANRLPVIGWAGSQQSLPEVTAVAKALTKILDQPRPVATAHALGVAPADLAKHGLQHPAVKVTQWVAGTMAYLRVIDFDIWVAPYRRTPFNQAKFPTKALEAAFLGVPLIASDIEPYRRWVSHGVTGFLVGYDREWEHYLRLLLDDPDLRARMGAAARLQATAHVMEGLAPEWVAALTPRPAHPVPRREGLAL